MASAGVLVGTTRPGRVKTSRKGSEFEYELSDGDRARLLSGLEVAGQIFLEAKATRVMPATLIFRQYSTVEELRRLPAELRDGDLLLTSAHPQGGNPIGTVVGEDFRVNGMDNVYLCDASVFPSCVRVNPQLTVMGMAEYAARRILGGELAHAPANPSGS
jgi:choline dehydrogenase-like flavoprotein